MASKRKRLVGGRHCAGVHSLPACGFPAGMSIAGPIDRRNSRFSLSDPCERKTNCKRQCVGSCLHPKKSLCYWRGGALAGRMRPRCGRLFALLPPERILEPALRARSQFGSAESGNVFRLCRTSCVRPAATAAGETRYPRRAIPWPRPERPRRRSSDARYRRNASCGLPPEISCRHCRHSP
jgi:hypothetical protein